MKKTFSLRHERIKTPRLADAIRHEVKQYIKRERKKALPENADFWDFACRFGKDEANSDKISLTEISDCISNAETTQMESFYLEIIAKPGQRTAKKENPRSGRAYLD
jgi:hypothetical protein